MRYDRAKKKCQRLNMDQLVEGTIWASKPHADVLYVSSDKGVIVEETGRPEHRDLVKVRTSIDMIRTHTIVKDIEIVAGIIHYRRSDTMFNKMLLSESKKKPPILPANCENQLHILIERLLGCS